MANAGATDVGDVIDRAPLTGFQIRIVILCALVAVLDGADSFSIGIAAPSIAAMLKLPMNQFGTVFSAALVGATLGAFAFGPLADRFGRKTMLVASVLIFAAFTFATPFADSVQALIAIRFLAGLGLGGATPCFLALAPEYTPTRMRARVTSALWAGFPLGGMLGGFLNAWLIGAFGWRAMFYVGGVLPLIVAGLIAVFVPESVRYLLARGAQPSRIAGILRRLAPGITLRPSFTTGETRSATAPAWLLFTEGRGLATPLLWVPYFMAFGVLVIVVLWTPALLRSSGMSAPNAALVVAFHGLGGFIGMAIAGRVLERFGSWALVPAFLLGAVMTLALGSVGISVTLASICDGLIGVFVGVGASGVIGFASLVYPTVMRSTGIGWAMGIGRLGQVAAPLIVGAMLQAGWTVDRVFLAVAAGPIIAALFVPLAAWAFGTTGRQVEDGRRFALRAAPESLR